VEAATSSFTLADTSYHIGFIKAFAFNSTSIQIQHSATTMYSLNHIDAIPIVALNEA
jgi:hypothetical protein